MIEFSLKKVLWIKHSADQAHSSHKSGIQKTGSFYSACRNIVHDAQFCLGTWSLAE